MLITAQDPIKLSELHADYPQVMEDPLHSYPQRAFLRHNPVWVVRRADLGRLQAQNALRFNAGESQSRNR